MKTRFTSAERFAAGDGNPPSGMTAADTRLCERVCEKFPLATRIFDVSFSVYYECIHRGDDHHSVLRRVVKHWKELYPNRPLSDMGYAEARRIRLALIETAGGVR
jgi:hypothetical protein